MSLPIITLPTDERWECRQCGICCRGSLVPLNPQDLLRLREQHWEERPEFRRTPVAVPVAPFSGTYRLNQRPDGSCVFLLDNGLCRIHAELGFAAKPTICRTFPLQLVPHEKQVVLTLRRACPTSAADLGRPLPEHLPFVQEFVREGRLPADGVEAPALKRDDVRDWTAVRAVLAAVARILQDERYPPVRRVVHATLFASLLERARTAAMSESKLLELIGVLEDAVFEEARPIFAERLPPTAGGAILFRQIAAEFLRLAPGYRPAGGWWERWRLFTAAWKTARGTGEAPALHPQYPRATFEQLEAPLGPLAPDIYRPLTRMLEVTSASFVYALANRSGWTILDSVRALAMTFPVGLYLLRWSSAGRAPAMEDMVNIIVALDRGQGYVSLTGGYHRRRLAILGQTGDLERIAAWYAR